MGGVLFLALTLAVTWPLAPQLGRAVPSDYGDPLYAAWAIAWVSRQLGRIARGDLQALVHFFDANQLHPEPAAAVEFIVAAIYAELLSPARHLTHEQIADNLAAAVVR